MSSRNDNYGPGCLGLVVVSIILAVAGKSCVDTISSSSDDIAPVEQGVPGATKWPARIAVQNGGCVVLQPVTSINTVNIEGSEAVRVYEAGEEKSGGKLFQPGDTVNFGRPIEVIPESITELARTYGLTNNALQAIEAATCHL